MLDSLNRSKSVFSGDKNAAPREGEKYVVFYLDEKIYAVNCEQVIEAIGSLSSTELPLALVPDWLAGIAGLRGEIVSVVNLRKLWKKPDDVASPENKFLVLRSKKKNYRAAFVVDKFGEMISVAAGDIQFSAADFESSFPTFFGRADYKSQTVFLLDAENLFLFAFGG